MKFVLKPSLEHMALVKISISLWNHNDVRTLISKFNYADQRQSEWEKIEERVMQKVSQLSLPELLKEKVFGVIKPIGIEICEWMRYYREYDRWIEYQLAELQSRLDLDLPAPLPVDLCWTPQGTVDRKRTAEVLVGCENLDVTRCYVLACDYCLEDDIIRFWNSLPEDVKEFDWLKFPLISFWSNKMKRVGVVQFSYQDLFYSSVQDGNKEAAKYFLRKIAPQEREETLKEVATYVDDADVLCFLLPKMEDQQQKEVLKSDPQRMFQFFLRWPWQCFFIKLADCMWGFLSKDNYDEILTDIFRKVREGYKDYNYQKLFTEFWQKSPSALKDSIMENIHSSLLLESLFHIKDKENIRLILKDATLTAKEKLIYSDTMKYFCERLINENEWDFFEFCIRECSPSKNDTLKFKERFEKHITSRSFKQNFTTKEHIWDKLFHFPDDSICESDKRSIEEGESISSKRF